MNLILIEIYVEGTTTNGKALICYKQGAFSAGVPVQPVLLRYRYWFLSPHWVPAGPRTPFLVFRMMCQFINFMEVEYLPVYTPSEAEIKDPILYADNVRHLCADKLKVPVTNHTFEDMLLMRQALEIKEPPESVNIDVSTIKHLYDVIDFISNFNPIRNLICFFFSLLKDGFKNCQTIDG